MSDPIRLQCKFCLIRRKEAKYKQNNEEKKKCCWGPVEQVKLLTQKIKTRCPDDS